MCCWIYGNCNHTGPLYDSDSFNVPVQSAYDAFDADDLREMFQS